MRFIIKIYILPFQRLSYAEQPANVFNFTASIIPYVNLCGRLYIYKSIVIILKRAEVRRPINNQILANPFLNYFILGA